MKLGLKVGLQNDWKSDIELTHPSMVEVWFDINRAPEYEGFFEYMSTSSTEVGLHFWGALPDGTMATIAHPDEYVTDASMNLIRGTIDVAAQHGCVYVNIHTGSRALYTVDFTAMTYPTVSEPVDLDRSIGKFMNNYQTLHAYAKERNVVLTVETVSRLVAKSRWYDESSRLDPLELYQLPIQTNIEAAKHGLYIANDFVHTATQCLSNNPAEIWHFLKTFTNTYASQTRLIHLGFLIPPFNGTDNHDMLDNPILDTDRALPNKNQMIELLKNFPNRDDVWILVEPKKDHAKNYLLAREILKTAGVLTENPDPSTR